MLLSLQKCMYQLLPVTHAQIIVSQNQSERGDEDGTSGKPIIRQDGASKLKFVINRSGTRYDFESRYIDNEKAHRRYLSSITFM